MTFKYLAIILLTPHLYDTCRTNSDSALHQSAMNPKPQEMFAGGSQELQPKRGNGISNYNDTKLLILGIFKYRWQEVAKVDLEGHIYQFNYQQYICMVCEKVLFLYSADSEDENGEGSIIHLLSMDYLFLSEALI